MSKSRIKLVKRGSELVCDVLSRYCDEHSLNVADVVAILSAVVGGVAYDYDKKGLCESKSVVNTVAKCARALIENRHEYKKDG